MRALLLCCALSSAVFAGVPISEPYTREVKVPAAGWYCVPVDGHMWRYARGRVLAFDESGKMLPCGILPVEVPLPQSEEAQPRLVKVEEENNHLVLYLKVDRLAGKHDRLILDFGGAELLEEVSLWGSMTGNDWKAMARGTLFRIGGGGRMQGTALDYPSSSFDQLKLILPMGGSLKQAIRDFRVGNIRLHYAPDAIIPTWVDERIAIHPSEPELTAALTGSDQQLFRLDLPSDLMAAHRIALGLELPHAPFPVSLMQMEKGNPDWVYSCTLDTSADSFPIPCGQLRPPAFIKLNRQHTLSESIVIKRPKEEVIFFVERAGILLLAYGGVEERAMRFPPVHRQAGMREATLGPAVAHPMALSPELRNMAAKAPTWKFNPHFQWELELPEGSIPGQWVRVEVTPDLMAIIKEAHGGGWGIAVGDRVVDTIWKVDPMPVLAKQNNLKLAPEQGFPMRSAGEFNYTNPSGTPFWLSLQIPMHSEPISVTAEVSFPKDAYAQSSGEKPARPWHVVGQTMLECGPWTTDCMSTMRCLGLSFENILISAEGANLLPPERLNVSLWRYRNWLIFPAPASPNPKLFFGNSDHGITAAFESHIDRERFPDDLSIARIGKLTDQAAQKRPWDRILFIAGLVLAVAVLLYLIVKLLPKKEAA